MSVTTATFLIQANQRRSHVRLLVRYLAEKHERMFYQMMLNQAGIGPDVDEHPETWDGPCICKLCMSYGE